MCRILCANAGMKRDEAIYLLEEMLRDNTDAVGYSYVCKITGKIITRKWPLSLTKILKVYGKTFLGHMPHNAYTIIHLRKATIGSFLDKAHAHPFEIGGEIGNPRWSFIHNGYFKQHIPVRFALEKFVNFQSENDSETAAQLINLSGFQKFNETCDDNGVFVGLNRDNNISISRTWSRELELSKTKDGSIIFSSEFPKEYDSQFILQGYYKYDRFGKLLANKEKSFKSTTISHVWDKAKEAGFYNGCDY